MKESSGSKSEKNEAECIAGWAVKKSQTYLVFPIYQGDGAIETVGSLWTNRLTMTHLYLTDRLQVERNAQGYIM